tara:strand:+ start:632 stop:841 length:210 start_codon:yes stop_codon:yes gene_type:complete
MQIQFEATISLTEDFVENSFYTQEGDAPTVEEIVHRAIEDIDSSHRFGVSYEAKNITIKKLEVGVRKDG